MLFGLKWPPDGRTTRPLSRQAYYRRQKICSEVQRMGCQHVQTDL
jgi:hypothetical protein